MEKLDSRVVLVEKDIHRDREAVERYKVNGAPTFVLIDAHGRERGRMFTELNPDRFEEQVRKIAGL